MEIGTPTAILEISTFLRGKLIVFWVKILNDRLASLIVGHVLLPVLFLGLQRFARARTRAIRSLHHNGWCPAHAHAAS